MWKKACVQIKLFVLDPKKNSINKIIKTYQLFKN